MMDRLIRPPIQNMRLELMPLEPPIIHKPMEAFFSNNISEDDQGPEPDLPM